MERRGVGVGVGCGRWALALGRPNVRVAPLDLTWSKAEGRWAQTSGSPPRDMTWPHWRQALGRYVRVTPTGRTFSPEAVGPRAGGGKSDPRSHGPPASLAWGRLSPRTSAGVGVGPAPGSKRWVDTARSSDVPSDGSLGEAFRTIAAGQGRSRRRMGHLVAAGVKRPGRPPAVGLGEIPSEGSEVNGGGDEVDTHKCPAQSHRCPCRSARVPGGSPSPLHGGRPSPRTFAGVGVGSALGSQRWVAIASPGDTVGGCPSHAAGPVPTGARAPSTVDTGDLPVAAAERPGRPPAGGTW